MILLLRIKSCSKKKIGALETKSNKVFFANDALNQYSRHESFRIHGIPEVDDSSKENCAEEAVKIARKMGFEVEESAFQRCHRLGKKKEKKKLDPSSVEQDGTKRRSCS